MMSIRTPTDALAWLDRERGELAPPGPIDISKLAGSKRERALELGALRGVLIGAQRDREVVDALAVLCPCETDPALPPIGPEADCPVHGDGPTFVALFHALRAVCHMADRVVNGRGTSAHASGLDQLAAAVASVHLFDGMGT